MPACSCSLACPGCVAVLVVPCDNEAGTCFAKTSRVCPGDFLCWKERLLPLLTLNVPIKGFLFPELTSTVHKNTSNKTRAFSQQNSTSGAAMIGTITMWNRSKKQSLGPPAWDPESLLVYSLTVHLVGSLNHKAGFIGKLIFVIGKKKAILLDRHSVLDIAHSNTQVFRKQTDFQSNT